MRLLRLVALGLVGYTIYEFSRSIWSRTSQAEPGAQPTPASNDSGNNISPAREADQRRQVLTGSSGQGMEVDVIDRYGATRRARVGRGVIS